MTMVRVLVVSVAKFGQRVVPLVRGGGRRLRGDPLDVRDAVTLALKADIAGPER